LGMAKNAVIGLLISCMARHCGFCISTKLDAASASSMLADEAHELIEELKSIRND